MRKIQFCAGSAKLAGWECHDIDMDIRKPLPIPDSAVSHIHIEHGLEHVSHQEAWSFLGECRRILVIGGRIRVAIPDVARMLESMRSPGGHVYAKSASAEGTVDGAIRAAIFNHGHKAAWNGQLLMVFLECNGFFDVQPFEIGVSDDPYMRGLERHGKTVGEDVNRMETTVLEAVRRD